MLYVAHDPIGVKGLYYGFSKGMALGICSEMKGLHDICDTIAHFPPGSYLTYHIGDSSFQIKPWFNLDFRTENYFNFEEQEEEQTILAMIRKKFIAGV